jgi:predicted SAM-dependent methyltransferase
MTSPLRLHLGCGPKYIKGFTNVDILQDSEADLISDITKLREFKDNTVELIYASHVLEHISRHDYKTVLKRWFNLLKKGGILRLALPDLFELAKYYAENKNIDEVRGCIYGGQKDQYDYHYFGHDFNSLKTDLEEIGFITINRFDWRDLDYKIKDWSRDYLPKHYDNGEMIPDEEWYKGTLISLNIEAIK